MTPTLKDLQQFAFTNAMKKGLYDKPQTALELIAKMHCELSEASEELMKGKAVDEIYWSNETRPEKPMGVPIELADCFILIMSFCGYFGIDLEKAVVTKIAYNSTRPHGHGDKKR